MKYIKITSLFIMCLFYSCTRNTNPFQSNEISQSDLLIKSYEENSVELLNEFFIRWQNEVTPIDVTNIESDTLKTLYDIFNEFYQPFNLSFFGSEWGDSLYYGIKYIILQTSISYVIVDSIFSEPPYPDNYSNYIHIDNFYPNLSFDNAEYVFLTMEYDSLLLNFLGDRESWDEPIEYDFERIHKQEFLNNLTKIIGGHWGFGWHIITHPLGQVIRINKAFTKARVSCRIIYEWGWADLEKKNGKWHMVDADLPLIE